MGGYEQEGRTEKSLGRERSREEEPRSGKRADPGGFNDFLVLGVTWTGRTSTWTSGLAQATSTSEHSRYLTEDGRGQRCSRLRLIRPSKAERQKRHRPPGRRFGALDREKNGEAHWTDRGEHLSRV